jgi:hypothetical protein
MPRRSPPRITFAAAFALALGAGCAVSEPIDRDDIVQPGTGVAGSSAGGTPGSGTAGIGVSGPGGSATGTTPTGTGGVSGAAGTGKVNITSGQAGNGTSGGTTGAGGANASGQAGSGVDGGIAGATGIAGRGGTTGSAGRGGTTGTAGGGGTTGFAGRGGTTGSAGRGGTTGSAGRGGTSGAADGGTIDAGGNPDGAAAPTFTDIYTTILVPYCAGSSCHSPGTQGGVSFASQSAAYSAVSRRVTPGNGAGSSFYTTVNSGSMPRGAAKLSATNLAKIKAWIDAGALNN